MEEDEEDKEEGSWATADDALGSKGWPGLHTKRAEMRLHGVSLSVDGFVGSRKLLWINYLLESIHPVAETEKEEGGFGQVRKDGVVKLFVVGSSRHSRLLRLEGGIL